MDNNKLFEFIKRSTSAYQTVETVRGMLTEAGYAELFESELWSLENGKGYFVTRNGSSIIAFRYVEDARGFMIAASHSDCPSLRVKMSGEQISAYSRLDVEKYGGIINYSWLDRPLSVSGRVVLRDGDGMVSRGVDLDADIAVIPSVAIHMNRTVNDGVKFNLATDMLPLCGIGGERSLMPMIAEKLGVKEGDILSHDLFLYNREEPRLVGTRGELILAPRLDDLACAYTSTEAFISARPSASVPVLAIFDNEEVCSATKQGAASDFLRSTLISVAGGSESCRRMLASSLMVSADNAHALHPNHPELSDKANAPTLGGGVVIKFNASQRYATDGISHGLFSLICERAGVKTQMYYNRADLPGGSTLGSISNTVVSLPTVDIGIAQLAMHSATETAAIADVQSMKKALGEFYSVSLIRVGDGFELN